MSIQDQEDVYELIAHCLPVITGQFNNFIDFKLSGFDVNYSWMCVLRLCSTCPTSEMSVFLAHAYVRFVVKFQICNCRSRASRLAKRFVYLYTPRCLCILCALCSLCTSDERGGKLLFLLAI